MDTTLQGDTTQPMDRDEKGEPNQEEKPDTVEQVDNETSNSGVTLKDPGNEDVKRAIIDGSSSGETLFFTSQYLKPIAANLTSKNAGEETRTNPLSALKQTSDSSMDVDMSKSSSRDIFYNPTVSGEAVKESGVKHEKKPESCAESETRTELELEE